MVNGMYHLNKSDAVHENKTFKLSDITKIFNIKRHFVIHLVETGIIKPFKDAKGRGKSRIYSYKNLIQIGIFIHLNKLELSYEMIRNVLVEVDNLMKYHTNSIETFTYICVLGFLNGEIHMYGRYDLFPNETLPEEFLSKCVNDHIKEKGIKKNTFAYYFILDLANIKAYIDSKVT